MRSLRWLPLTLLCSGCNIVYPAPALFAFDVPSYTFFDRSRVEAGRPDAVAVNPVRDSAVGQPCEDAACPWPLVCAARSCGPERSCAAPVTLCGQQHEPVCDCAGTTLQNECAARATGVGVAYAGACDGRAADGGALDASTDAAADAVAADATANRCASLGCDDGYICCAEPTSPAYGRCQPLACPTCCRRSE
jgi:hypothetical protein